MSSIVERLRAMALDSIGPEAADELERLQTAASAFEQAWKDACARAEGLAEELAALRLDMAQLRDELEEARA